MGAPHVRRVGAPDDQNGLPHRIHGPVPSDPVSDVDQDPGKGEPPSRHGDGPPENARKTSCEDRRPSAGRARLLLFPLFSGEEIRRLETHFKPEGIKRRGKTPVVQNGYPSVRPSFTRRGYPPIPVSKYAGLGTGHVGRLSRLRGRLLPCRDRSSRQEISEVRVRQYRLRVPSLAVRPFYGPKNVHTSGTGRRRLPQDMRGQSVPISGRLARRRRVIRPNPTILIPGPHLRPGNRVPHKRGEIGLGPDPVPVLPRLQPGPSQGPGPSVRRPHRPAPSSDRTGHERRIVHSPSVEIPVRTSGEHDVSGPKSQTTHPPAPVLCPEPMVPGHAGHNPDTPDPECPDPARVVARPHQLDFRSSFLNSRPGTDNSDRCFILRMGRSPGRPDGFWRLARPMEEQAHQLAGTPGSVANSETFSGPGSKPSSGSPIRQFHHGLLHQQAGRDTLPDPMPPGPGHVGMVRPTGHCTSSSPSSRDTQRPSGRTVQGEVLPDGVVPTPSDAQSPVLNLGDSHGRPVRNTEEQETTDVLLPIQGTRVERGQCPDSELGRSVRVCIPPHSTAPQSAQEDQTPPNSGGDPSGPILAEPNLVPPTNPDVSGLPQEVARQVEPPEELRDGGIVPRTQQAPIGCVENLRQSYRAQGFSEAVAKLASCGKRPSTYRVYDSRLAHYSRWCTTRSLDPNSAPVQQIAEFLSDLAKMTEPGHSLSYNTIVGYRTAIGAIHTGFSEGVTVSNHPVLQSVMKGIFNSKATTRQLKPVWDLPKVLGHLSQAPFEPMARASLRNLSVKTAFLIQLASGRRGGWIHACRMDPAYLRKESGGFTFLSSLILDKNQSAHFTPEPVFIAALSDHSPDDKLHCPIRALKWYLDKTKTIRGQEKALFISSKEPHSKAAKLTIAGWVKEAIAGTYRDLPLEERLAMNIRAHDTRGVAASWARAAGVSIPEIMNAAAWSTPVTFAKFYLKDLPNQKGKFGNAVLSTAGTFKP